jgi:hypothetical protein
MATAVSTQVNVLGAFRAVRDTGNVHSDCVPVNKGLIHCCRIETGQEMSDQVND